MGQTTTTRAIALVMASAHHYLRSRLPQHTLRRFRMLGRIQDRSGFDPDPTGPAATGQTRAPW